MTTTIFTAIFGGKDKLKSPQGNEIGVRYVCFTDDEELNCYPWEIVICEPTNVQPCRAAKVYKICPHLFDSNLRCERSIWVDGNLQLVRPITHLFEQMQSDLAFFKHEHLFQDCIYGEALECIKWGKEDAHTISKAVERYRIRGHPEHWGLPMGRVILRRHTEQVIQFNEAWWGEIEGGSMRDQLSLPFVLRTMKFPYDEFAFEVLHGIRGRSPLVDIRVHTW